jgi:hypothetical protein
MGEPPTDEFGQAVRRAFAWLEDEFASGVWTLADGVVEFHVGRVFLAIGRVASPDPRFKLLDSRLGIRDETAGDAVSYSIRAVARHVDRHLTDTEIRNRLHRGRFPANSLSETEQSLRRLADEWRRRLDQLPLNDDSFWSELRREADLRVMALADDRARDQAILAFNRGEYAEALSLYESVPGKLSPSDRKRIEIARKRLHG